MRTIKKYLLAITLAIGMFLTPATNTAVVGASAEAASTVKLVNTQFDLTSPVVRIDSASGTMFAHASPALLTFEGVAEAIFAYCINPFVAIPNGAVNPPANYEVTTISNILSTMSPENLRKVAYLALTGPLGFGYEASVNQAAIWTFFNATVTSENLAFQTAFLARAAAAQQATDAQLAQLIGYKSIDKQNMVQDFATAVPEPATWAMLIVGFGGVGFVARRRPANRRTVVFA